MALYRAERLPAAQAAWEQAPRAAANTWVPLKPEAATSVGGAILTPQPDLTVVSSGKNAPTDVYTFTFTGELGGVTGLQLEALGEPRKGRTAGRGRTGGAILSELTATVQAGKRGKAQPVKFRSAIATHSPEEAPIAAAIDGDTATGWSTGANPGETHRAVFELAEPLTLKPGEMLTLTLDQRGGYGEAFRRLRFSVTRDAPPLGSDTLSETVAAALAIKKEDRTSEQAEAARPLLRAARSEAAPARSRAAGAPGAQARSAENEGAGPRRVEAARDEHSHPWRLPAQGRAGATWHARGAPSFPATGCRPRTGWISRAG